MTALRPTSGLSLADTGRIERSAGDLEQHQRTQHTSGNIGGGERAVSIAAGAILAAIGIARRSGPGLLTAAVGGALLYRGVSGRCPVYRALEINTSARADDLEERIARRGIHVEQAFLINRPPEELYQYWRNFEHLPGIMSHLKQVRALDGQRSHWIAHAPRMAGGSVEWDAEITHDEPNKSIAWRSLPGADVDNAGEVRFTPAPGDRGTEVHVTMSYLPPAGRVGHWIARLFGSDADQEIRDDLRSFKRVMEIGEALTIDGQPHGTCTGVGRRYRA